jgi:Glycine zipper
MKQILSALSIALVMTACTSNPSADTTKSATTVDTSGLAEFQAFKQQAAMMKMYEMQNMNAGVAAVAPQTRTTTTYASAPVRRTSRPRYSSRSNDYQSGSMSSSTGNTAKAKRGWSKAAKGAVIGGATGAAAGAIINKKNRAVGAVIGGVVGAGGGYVIGRGMDKRDGRL